MFELIERHFYDFNARICAIREIFEEINILIAKSIDGSKSEAIHGLRDEYEKVFKCNFIEFCKAKQIIPDLNGIYGYRRVSSGI